MTAKKVDYPAKLVGYRIDVVNDRIVLFEDIPALFNDRELERRIGTYRALEPGMGRGGHLVEKDCGIACE